MARLKAWRGLSILVALALVLALGIIALPMTGMVGASPDEWYVDGVGTDDGSHGTGPGPMAFKTIQYAIDDARVTDGDIINVAAGTYAESIIIDKSLTLVGAQADVEPVAGGRSGESNIEGQVTVESGNVVINGFEISAGDRGVAVQTVADQERTNISILYNYIHNEGRYNVLTEVADNATLSNLVISHNYISDAKFITSGGEGIGLSSGFITGKTYVYNGLEISHNTITDIERNGIFAGGDNALLDILNPVIAHNYIHDSGWFGMNVGSMCDAEISNNTFERCEAGGAYIQVLVGTVTGNVFRDTGPAPWGASYETYGLSLCGTEEYFPEPSHNVSVIGNTFFFNEDTDHPQYGARVRSGADASTIEFLCNNFWGGGALPDPLALWNKVDGVILKATHNWWGDASGPTHAGNPGGSGGAVSDYIDYDPWSGAELTQGCCETVCGCGTMHDTPTGGDVTIDATGNHTIAVCTYAEIPCGTCPFTNKGSYYDVHLDDTTVVNSLVVQFCPAQEDEVICYWNGATWVPCSDQVYSDGCIVVTITKDTKPGLSDLTGLPFGKGFRVPVGGEAYPVSKISLLAPWIAVGIVLAGGLIWYVLRRRRVQS